MPAARPVDPDSPPRKGPRVEQRAIVARTRCATALRLRRAIRDADAGVQLGYSMYRLPAAFGQKRTFAPERVGPKVSAFVLVPTKQSKFAPPWAG